MHHQIEGAIQNPALTFLFRKKATSVGHYARTVSDFDLFENTVSTGLDSWRTAADSDFTHERPLRSRKFDTEGCGG